MCYIFGQDKMYFMYPLLIFCTVTPLVKLENVTSKLHEYTAATFLMIDQTIELIGQVTVQNKPYGEDNHLYLEFKTNKSKEFLQFSVLFLNKCDHKNKTFYCVQKGKLFQIYAYIHVKEDFNQSTWRLKGLYNEIEFESEVITLPTIKQKSSNRSL
ncbi:uncharacterized protein LOC129922862 isoform X2 [Biomphalaria glabrata]|uniref:Uncharacterized protein LOC129922862 isoform X2 n=1 Tax=Biomphalaria glabrata TaxID=6526 RepID=A0A9W2YVN1_BIOGL|nr:uncharacterized protein LOC129922862 isoform X2 [Biomphalaria glabrata]